MHQNNLPFDLSSPTVHYADQSGESIKSYLQDWVFDHQDTAWWLSDGKIEFRCRLMIDQACPGQIFEFQVTSLKEIKVRHCGLTINIPSLELPYYLNRQFQWKKLKGTQWLHELIPLKVRWHSEADKNFELSTIQSGISGHISYKRKYIKIHILFDSPALHPRVQFTDFGLESRAMPTWAKHQTFKIQLQLQSCNEPVFQCPIIPFLYPAGRQAAFVLTDHCDLDSTGSMELFLNGDDRDNGWLFSGLKMTKSVFTLHSESSASNAASTLEDRIYHSQIKSLYDDGNEIVPHALQQAGELEVKAFHENLKQFAEEWHPSVWIDHGTSLPYCYSKGGASHSGYKLLETLRAHKFQALWSFFDLPSDVSAGLNLLVPRKNDGYYIVCKVFKHIISGRFLVGFHYIRSFLRWHIRGDKGFFIYQLFIAFRRLFFSGPIHHLFQKERTEKVFSVLKRAVHQYRNHATLLKEPFRRDDILRYAPVFFPERGVPLNQMKKDDLLLFNTFEVLHIRDAYSKHTLEKLISQRGLHIAHCYLLNHSVYHAGIFKKNGRYTLSREWTWFIYALKAYVNDEKIWNPSIQELLQWIKFYTAITCYRTDDCLYIQNPNGSTVRDFSILIPLNTDIESIRFGDEKPKKIVQVRDWFIITGDLPAKSSLYVNAKIYKNEI